MSWIVEVEWTDASVDQDEVQEHELTGVARARTVGVLLRQDAHQVSIAAEVLDYRGSPRAYRSVTHIPRGMVKTVRRLRRFE